MATIILPAAGQGKRMHAGVNKVFLELSGKPMLVHTMLRFSACPEVDGFIIPAGEAEIPLLQRILKVVPHLKPYEFVIGGTERQYSIANALAKIPAQTDVVLVHDAARPLVSRATIEKVIQEASDQGAAIAAVPEKNTVKVIDQDGVVRKTPDRRTLWEVQTPQGFRKEILLDAYRKAEQDGFLGTDDASLVERLGVPVRVVRSDYRNIKVTTPEDLVIAEALLRQDKVRSAKVGVHSMAEYLKRKWEEAK